MFTINQIKEAHAKVQSGADFPKYVQELIELGVIRYDNYVNDGHCIYFGKNDFNITSEAEYASITIAEISDTEKFKHCLKIHQQGQTNYPTFCSDAAETGVEKWTVDMLEMTCTYYDKAGNKMVVENIPLP